MEEEDHDQHGHGAEEDAHGEHREHHRHAPLQRARAAAVPRLPLLVVLRGVRPPLLVLLATG
jgi:hypothetical protein